MDLQKLFGENAESVAKVIDEKGLVLFEKDTGEWVPKDRITEIKKKAEQSASEQVEKLKEQIKQRDTDLATLKETAKDSESMKEQIEVLEQQNKEATEKYEKELLVTKKKHFAELKLHESGATHPELLINKINLDAMTEQNGDFIGVDDQIKILKENDYKDLFGQPKVKGDPPKEGDLDPDDDKIKNPWVKGDNYSMTEQVKLMNSKPELATRMRKEAGVT